MSCAGEGGVLGRGRRPGSRGVVIGRPTCLHFSFAASLRPLACFFCGHCESSLGMTTGLESLYFLEWALPGKRWIS